MDAPPPAIKARFAGFELDLRSGELAGSGRQARLQAQPFCALQILLQKAGDVVTREELQQQLWPDRAFGDFDHGLNKTISKLRDTFDRLEATSSLIETLPRRGYRLCSQVDWIHPPEDPTRPESSKATAREPHGRKLWISLPVALAMALLTASQLAPNGTSQYFRTLRAMYAPAQPVHSLAVLPLLNLSGDPGQEYLADGITDALITELARIYSLRVVSRTSVMQHKNTHKSLQQLARELNVDALVEGSFARSGNQIRVTAQLIDVKNDNHLWAQSFESDVGDVLPLEDTIARNIASHARVALGAAHPPSGPTETGSIP